MTGLNIRLKFRMKCGPVAGEEGAEEAEEGTRPQTNDSCVCSQVYSMTGCEGSPAGEEIVSWGNNTCHAISPCKKGTRAGQRKPRVIH